MKRIFEKLLSLLRIRATAAGLEISDQVIRLVAFNGRVWQMHVIRLEPGILESGKVKDRAALVTALKALKAKFEGGGNNRKVNVIACLSAVPTYTQVFGLPIVQDQSLEEAVQLNLQMASPLEEGEAYSGWQLLGRNEKSLQLEILSVFIEKCVVDDMVDSLFEAGFIVMAVESKALALTRMLREKGAGIDAPKPYLFLSIDNAGVDFLVIRNGSLYFEYSTLWRDLADEKGNVTVEQFESSLTTSMRQVMNYYSQHWPEPVSAVILSAMALEDSAEKVLASTATFPSAKLTLVMGQPVSPEWLTALGCSLRGMAMGGKHANINLLGENSRDRFHEEQLLSFMRFWRVVVPVTLSLLIATFAAAYFFLMSTRASIESRSDFNMNGGQNSEVAALEASAQSFNQSVALLVAAESSIRPKGRVIDTVASLAAQKNITMTRMTFQAFGTPISLSGSSKAQDNVTAFKTALEADPHIRTVNLPLTGIQTNGSTVSFTMSFPYVP